MVKAILFGLCIGIFLAIPLDIFLKWLLTGEKARESKIFVYVLAYQIVLNIYLIYLGIELLFRYIYQSKHLDFYSRPLSDIYKSTATVTIILIIMINMVIVMMLLIVRNVQLKRLSNNSASNCCPFQNK